MTETGITWDKPEEKPKRRSLLSRLVFWLVCLVVLLVLPFATLIRVSTYVYSAYETNTWLSLAAGVVATALVITVYSAIVSKKLTGKARIRVLAKRVALPLVLAYCGYALLYLSSVNAKTEEVREYYGSMHPMLRLAVSTFILVDRDIVITDSHRTPEDYAAMGLPVQAESQHYRQGDGFVHAMDLRTAGREEWKNTIVESYFRLAGFQTLRHVGTADHLHVALPTR